MKFLRKLALQTGRLLSAQARRLRANLERLALQVREAVARTVSQAVAEAAHEALQIVLQGAPMDCGPWPPMPDEFRRSWDTDECDDPRRRSSRQSPTLYESQSEEIDPEHEFDTDEQSIPHQVPKNPQPRHWVRALVVGCQTAAWWLRRYKGRLSGLAATGVGVAAGLVALVASPALASAGSAAATALSVLALADVARAAAASITTGWL